MKEMRREQKDKLQKRAKARKVREAKLASRTRDARLSDIKAMIWQLGEAKGWTTQSTRQLVQDPPPYLKDFMEREDVLTMEVEGVKKELETAFQRNAPMAMERLRLGSPPPSRGQGKPEKDHRYAAEGVLNQYGEDANTNEEEGNSTKYGKAFTRSISVGGIIGGDIPEVKEWWERYQNAPYNKHDVDLMRLRGFAQTAWTMVAFSKPGSVVYIRLKKGWRSKVAAAVGHKGVIEKLNLQAPDDFPRWWEETEGTDGAGLETDGQDRKIQYVFQAACVFALLDSLLHSGFPPDKIEATKVINAARCAAHEGIGKIQHRAGDAMAVYAAYGGEEAFMSSHTPSGGSSGNGCFHAARRVMLHQLCIKRREDSVISREFF